LVAALSLSTRRLPTLCYMQWMNQSAISSDLVAALSLSTRRLPTLCYTQWMNQSGMLKITHKAKVKFSIGNYIDTVDCDVAAMSVCHLLLGQPW
jgi:hypothetical protein